MFKRRKLLETLEKYRDTPEAVVITGFRRVGKTALIRHIYEHLPTKNKLFLDLENPINQQLFETTNYDLIPQAFFRQGLDTSKKAYVFLDEIQFVKTLPSVVKYLYDHYKIKFYLTGSSSFYLKNLFSESLAGRKFLFELFPLDFQEFLWFKNSTYDTSLGFALLQGFYEEYLQFGGFPSVVLAPSVDVKAIELDNILGSYFQLDVQHLSQFHDNRNLRSLLLLLAPRVGSKADASKLADTLGVSRATVYHYLDFLSQTYLIYQLPAFSASIDVTLRHNPKIYFCDTGLLNRIAQVSRGQLFENKIFNQLTTRIAYSSTKYSFSDQLHYYQRTSGAEIDFILNKTAAYEVKLTASASDEVKLKKVVQKIGMSLYYVVSLEKIRSTSASFIYPFTL